MVVPLFSHGIALAAKVTSTKRKGRDVGRHHGPWVICDWKANE
jgi:hypothetical protein